MNRFWAFLVIICGFFSYSVRANAEPTIKTAVLTPSYTSRKPYRIVSNFKPQDRIFYCVVNLKDAPAGTKVKVVWTIVSAPGYNNFKKFEHEAVLRPNDNIAWFFTSFDKDWPKGKYRTDLYLDGKYKKSINFYVTTQPQLLKSKWSYEIEAQQRQAERQAEQQMFRTVATKFPYRGMWTWRMGNAPYVSLEIKANGQCTFTRADRRVRGTWSVEGKDLVLTEKGWSNPTKWRFTPHDNGEKIFLEQISYYNSTPQYPNGYYRRRTYIMTREWAD